MKAIERRFGWLPATLNIGAAMMSGVAPFFRDDLAVRVQGYKPMSPHSIACRSRNA